MRPRRWQTARGQLDAIHRKDPERVEILRQVIAYAEQRITEKKV